MHINLFKNFLIFVLLLLLFSVDSQAIPIPKPPPPGFPPPWAPSFGRGYWNYPWGGEWDDNPLGNSRWKEYGLQGTVTTLGGEVCHGLTNTLTRRESTHLTLEIDNRYVAKSYVKKVWIQFDYYENADTMYGPFIEGDVDNNWNTNDVTEWDVDSKLNAKSLGNNWKRAWFIWKLDPQPNKERIKWDFTTDPGEAWGIKNVYYGYKCFLVPEPNAALLIITGLIGIAGLRKIKTSHK